MKVSESCAVFLDKDGTLVEDVPYNVDPDRIRLAPGAVEGLARLHAAGYRLIVVSNQAGVARGLFAEAALAAVEDRLRSLLAAHGIPLAGFEYCPHHPDGRVPGYAQDCSCRKPEPGMILRAARRHAIDPARSWMVGDILDDVEAGRRAGCRTVLIDNGHETEWLRSEWRWPHFVAPDLAEAARIILASGEPEMTDSKGRGPARPSQISDGPGRPVPPLAKGGAGGGTRSPDGPAPGISPARTPPTPPWQGGEKRANRSPFRQGAVDPDPVPKEEPLWTTT